MSQVIQPCLDCNAPATVTIKPYGAGSMSEVSCPNCGVSYDTNLDTMIEDMQADGQLLSYCGDCLRPLIDGCNCATR